MDVVLGDLLSDPDQPISELLDTLWRYLAALGAQLDLGQGSERASQCLCHPGTAETLWPHDAVVSCTRRNPGPTAPT